MDYYQALTVYGFGFPWGWGGHWGGHLQGHTNHNTNPTVWILEYNSVIEDGLPLVLDNIDTVTGFNQQISPQAFWKLIRPFETMVSVRNSDGTMKLGYLYWLNDTMIFTQIA